MYVWWSDLELVEEKPSTVEYHTIDGTRYLCHADDHYCPTIVRPSEDGE